MSDYLANLLDQVSVLGLILLDLVVQSGLVLRLRLIWLRSGEKCRSHLVEALSDLHVFLGPKHEPKQKSLCFLALPSGCVHFGLEVLEL